MIYTAIDTFYLTHDQLQNSPSRKDNIDEPTETTLRIYGCDLIQESGILLILPQAVMATAQVLFHINDGGLCNNRFESFRTLEMGVPKSESAEVRLAWLRSQIIGGNYEVEYKSPFGKRTIVYADHTASGRSLLYIENFIINNVLPFYGIPKLEFWQGMLELKELKSKTLRFISAVHLQMGEFESVIKCVKVLREGDNEDRHPSLPVLALKAWLGLRRFAEAEKELRGMVVNKGIPESVWVSSVEAYFQAAGTAGAETAKEVFLGLFISRSRRHQDPEPVDRFQRC